MIALACFLALANHGRLLFDAPCESSCADDDAEGKCAANCTDCVCCSHAPQPVPLLAGSESGSTAAKQVDVEWAERVLPWVEPREILHVPIAA